ncbi:hypothetical protein FACS1894127_0460 [Clostridia bacterium]|nr:hypothetical protein FACS1894127_0460 [Clostridia bacterium]
MVRRSFKDVIKDVFYEELLPVMSGYIEDNISWLDLSTWRVPNPEHSELCDFTVHQVWLHDLGGFDIGFAVIAIAEVEVSEHHHSDVETDERTLWFRIPCTATLDGGLQNFRVEKVEIYSKAKCDKTTMLSDSLVPIISNEQLDAEASAFLRQYYPDALTTPMELPVEQVAANMGLTVKRIGITRNLTIFGMTVFADTLVQYFDHENQRSRIFGVAKGTIIVDPNVSFMRNIGCERNTIIHECVHWHKHRKYHEFAAMYDPEAKLIACRSSDQNVESKSRSDEEWMEWHANAIAPRILMPREMTLLKLSEYEQEIKTLLPEAQSIEVADYVIDSIAKFFNVSIASAKIRLLELDYVEAAGLYNYIDDHYISPFAFPVETDAHKYTYSIGIQDSFFEYFINPDFARYIDSGSFAYVDGHYVLEDEQYVTRNAYGTLVLTDYAIEHVDECCLRFGLVPNKNAQSSVEMYLETIALKTKTASYKNVPAFTDDDHNQPLYAAAEDIKRLRDEHEAENLERAEKGVGFIALARRHIKNSKMNRVVLAQRTLLSEKTLQRIDNDGSFKPNMETVMALCVGLKLPYRACEELFSSIGVALEGAHRNLIFRMILTSYHGHDIFSVNEVLESLNEKPLCEDNYRNMIESFKK